MSSKPWVAVIKASQKKDLSPGSGAEPKIVLRRHFESPAGRRMRRQAPHRHLEAIGHIRGAPPLMAGESAHDRDRNRAIARTKRPLAPAMMPAQGPLRFPEFSARRRRSLDLEILGRRLAAIADDFELDVLPLVKR